MLRQRIMRGWLALCQDERQVGHGPGELQLSFKSWRKYLDQDERTQCRINLDSKLTMAVHQSGGINHNYAKITAGNLYMHLPLEPNNLQRLAEMTGNWPIAGWWKEKNTCSPKMMKPR